jgi:hypothetical protein
MCGLLLAWQERWNKKKKLFFEQKRKKKLFFPGFKVCLFNCRKIARARLFVPVSRLFRHSDVEQGDQMSLRKKSLKVYIAQTFFGQN